MGWPVRKAIKEFERLSFESFSKSYRTGIPIFRNAMQLLYSYRYRDHGLNTALQSAFGQGLLFGPNESRTSEKVKVGVVAAVPGGRRPYLFTNYSRNSTGDDTDYLVREDDLEDEMKCWEAARCTSAAPTYFCPYYHRVKRQPYIDGAMHRNNPIQILEEERRAIWQDEAPPDILLSIGTGIQIGTDGTAKSASLRRHLLPRGIRGRIAVGHDVVQSTLDCNRQWDEFVTSMRGDRNTHSVCHRLNIGLEGRPPKLDDVDAIPKLKDEARRYLEQEPIRYLNRHYNSAHRHIVAVAQRLTAALFYFETISIDENEKCIGIVHCRLGRAMRENFRLMLSEGLTFRVRQRLRGGIWSRSDLRPDFDDSTFSGETSFQIRSEQRVIEVTLPRWSGSWEHISGFSALK